MRHVICGLLAFAAIIGNVQARDLNSDELETYAEVVRNHGLDCGAASSGRYVGQNERGISFIIYCGDRAYRILLTPENQWIVNPE